MHSQAFEAYDFKIKEKHFAEFVHIIKFVLIVVF